MPHRGYPEAPRIVLGISAPPASFSLAYYAMLAVFPFVIFLVALLGFLPIHGIVDQLTGYIQRAAPSDAGKLLAQAVHQVTSNRSPRVLIVSIAGAAASAASGMMSLMSALDRMSDIPPKRTRPIWQQAIVAFGLTFVMAAALIAALALLVAGGDLVGLLFGAGRLVRVAWNILRWPAAGLLLWTTLAFFFWAAPSMRPRFRWIAPGTLVALPLWFVLTMAFGFYVKHASYSSEAHGEEPPPREVQRIEPSRRPGTASGERPLEPTPA